MSASRLLCAVPRVVPRAVPRAVPRDIPCTMPRASFAVHRPVSLTAATPMLARRQSTASTTTTTTKPYGLPEFSLQDKVVIVSGGARGVGLVQAEALLDAGARVHALDRLPAPSPDFARIADKAQALGSGLTYHRIDVREEDKLNALVATIADAHGRLDGLVAAAAIQQETPALEYTGADFDRMLATNVTGVFLTAQAVARQMLRLSGGKPTSGSIALIASMSGSIANRDLICPAYNASKAAVLQLGRNLASEWGEHGIRVNTISPGYIVTAMTEVLFDKYPSRRADWANGNMLGRLSKPEEYRGAAVFLLSDASSYMTGSDLRIDGGHCAW